MKLAPQERMTQEDHGLEQVQIRALFTAGSEYGCLHARRHFKYMAWFGTGAGQGSGLQNESDLDLINQVGGAEGALVVPLSTRGRCSFDSIHYYLHVSSLFLLRLPSSWERWINL